MPFHPPRRPSDQESDLRGDLHDSRARIAADSRSAVGVTVAVVVHIEVKQSGVGLPALRRRDSAELPAAQ